RLIAFFGRTCFGLTFLIRPTFLLPTVKTIRLIFLRCFLAFFVHRAFAVPETQERVRGKVTSFLAFPLVFPMAAPVGPLVAGGSGVKVTVEVQPTSIAAGLPVLAGSSAVPSLCTSNR